MTWIKNLLRRIGVRHLDADEHVRQLFERIGSDPGGAPLSELASGLLDVDTVRPALESCGVDIAAARRLAAELPGSIRDSNVLARAAKRARERLPNEFDVRIRTEDLFLALLQMPNPLSNSMGDRAAEIEAALGESR